MLHCTSEQSPGFQGLTWVPDFQTGLWGNLVRQTPEIFHEITSQKYLQEYFYMNNFSKENNITLVI